MGHFYTVAYIFSSFWQLRLFKNIYKISAIGLLHVLNDFDFLSVKWIL